MNLLRCRRPGAANGSSGRSSRVTLSPSAYLQSFSSVLIVQHHCVLAMNLQKYSRPVDGTIPVIALLYNDEESYASQDSVGIYDGYVAFQGFKNFFPYGNGRELAWFLNLPHFLRTWCQFETSVVQVTVTAASKGQPTRKFIPFSTTLALTVSTPSRVHVHSRFSSSSPPTS